VTYLLLKNVEQIIQIFELLKVNAFIGTTSFHDFILFRCFASFIWLIINEN